MVKSKLGDIALPAPPIVSVEKLKGAVRSRPAELQGIRSRRRDGLLRTGRRAGHGDPAAAERYRPSRHAGPPLRQGRVLGGQVAISLTLDPEGRILHLNDGAQPQLRRACRSAHAADRGDCRRVRRGGHPGRPERDHPSGHVGEVGVHRLGRRHYLPDARLGRRHRGRRRRAAGRSAARRDLGDRHR